MTSMPGPADLPLSESWLTHPDHRTWLAQDALRQFAFFKASLRPDAGFYVLDYAGQPLPDTVQELHTATRLVHSYALGKLAGVPGCAPMIDAGLRYLRSHHHDKTHGGYVWGVDGDAVSDQRKLAYGHVFVLLAGSTAQMAGHSEGAALIEDVSAVLDTRYWEEAHGVLADEWNSDWTPFSTYRGMNANMHGVEGHLAAFEATGKELYLERAGRILDFFLHRTAAANDWRIPEHYTADWTVDPGYSGDPMFRPAGTTPGHSFEFARLLLQHWDLSGRPENGAVTIARKIVDTALADAWIEEDGGLVYTLKPGGAPDIRARYWWPVTEAIGVIASLLKITHDPGLEEWYRRLWTFAADRFVDHERGGWYPELGPDGAPAMTQFRGKPDIYHALQANLFPLTPGLSRQATTLPDLSGL